MIKEKIEKTLPKRGGVTRPLNKEDFSKEAALFLLPEGVHMTPVDDALTKFLSEMKKGTLHICMPVMTTNYELCRKYLLEANASFLNTIAIRRKVKHVEDITVRDIERFRDYLKDYPGDGTVGIELNLRSKFNLIRKTG